MSTRVFFKCPACGRLDTIEVSRRSLVMCGRTVRTGAFDGNGCGSLVMVYEDGKVDGKLKSPEARKLLDHNRESIEREMERVRAHFWG
jgi:hypothetical protein